MLFPPTDSSIVARRAEIVAALRGIVPDGVVADASGLATFDADALSAYHQMPLVCVLPSNREQVSAILNLSDGMLADFLRLQIICTINCSAGDIDPALLRPGRLVCHRVFGRLDYAQAARLAESLGRQLPQARDYSLAEVFAEYDTDEIKRPRIGFGVRS